MFVLCRVAVSSEMLCFRKKPMNNQIVDLLTGLDNRSGQDAAYIETKRFFENLGFNYVNILLASKSSGPLGIYTNMRSDWLTHYMSEGYDACDPLVELAAAQDVTRLCDPFSNQFLSTRDKNKSNKMLLEVQEEGLVSSLVISRHSSISDQYVGFNLGSELDRSKAQGLISANTEAIRLGTALTQVALIEDLEKKGNGAHWLPFRKTRSLLSEREAEVLKWLSEGFRNDRIADIMGISNANVNFHVISTKRKLGAKTREQAVAIALINRLI